MQTRCPHCQTRFRVTTEQLKLRQGQVRCGACHEIFDALDSLTDEAFVLGAVEAPPADPVHESQPLPDGYALPQPLAVPVATVTPVAGIEPAANESAEPEQTDETELATDPWPTAETEPVPVIAAETEPEPEVEPAPETPPPAETEPAEAEPAESEADEAEPAEAEPAEAEPAEAEPDETTTATEATPETAEDWQAVPAVKPVRRWPWVIGSIALLLAVAAQLAYLFRVELAVVAPDTRPALVAGCELLGCDLPRPSKPEQIDIETSDLAPQGTGLLLTATLRNRAPFEQEYPHLELTLTDTQDAALVRKVIAPAEYLPAGQVPAAGFAAGGRVDIRLALALDDVPAVGYRLYFFFP